jgi:hypothetical protein
VETLAAAVYDWRGHVHIPESYWLTGQRAADVYGCTGVTSSWC